jgi:hypothetical protein
MHLNAKNEPEEGKYACGYSAGPSGRHPPNGEERGSKGSNWLVHKRSSTQAGTWNYSPDDSGYLPNGKAQRRGGLGKPRPPKNRKGRRVRCSGWFEPFSTLSHFAPRRYGTQPGRVAACRIHVANFASSSWSSS